MSDLQRARAGAEHQKARAALLQALVVLLWVVIAFAIGMLPAAIVAGWKWFL